MANVEMPDQVVSKFPRNEEKKLNKRRSCELVSTPTPCINKALFHLERLKGLVKTGGAKEQQVPQSILKQDNEDVRPTGTRKQIRFLTPSSFPPPGDQNVELSVQGLGGKSPSETSEPPEGDMMKQIQLKPHQVFTQVAELITRLEADRLATESALEHERERVKKLVSRLDDLSQRRMIELPAAVQKEHEACACDISELQWHVSYTTRQLERSKERVHAAQLLNASLKEDINFVKKHCPLVEEKLLIEKESMKEIKSMQRDTDDELAEARIKLDQAEQKYQEATEKAERERQKAKENLEAVRSQLKMLKTDLHHSEAMFKAYLKKAEQSLQKLTHQNEELVVLQNKTEKVRELEQHEVYKIEGLRDEVKQVEFETGEVTRQKVALDNEVEEMHKGMREKIYNLEEKYRNSLKSLRELQETNRDMKYDIEDMNDEIKTCDKAVSKAEREIERYRKERDRCEQQLKTAGDEVSNISMINIELKNQLEKEETKSQSLEDALKSTSENLRKHVNEEMRQRTALEAKRQQNSSALLKGKTENVKKKQKVSKNLEKTQNAVVEATREVEELTIKHDETVKNIARLETKLKEINDEHEKTERELKGKRDAIEPVERKLQTEQMELKSRIKEMKHEEQQMSQKLNDMRISENAMNKRIHTTEENIKKLKEELEELEIKLTTGEKRNEDLNKQLEGANARFAEREKIHEEVMSQRLEVKTNLEENVKEEMEKNKMLAQRYRELQSEHIDLKNRLMDLYDSKVKLETSIKDHKQLVTLQEKLNVALKQYYHDRGEFNKAGLEKFHVRSHDNTDKMSKVQGGLEVALDNISLFLKSQIDGSAANRVHQAAMDWLTTP
nr:coiled-coil domain-containing protein 178-like isoform X1 [Ciona intestinalis]|eukprot:XP_009861454.2 coiled-coil domain-containing protein 178-like isoform X1 [Ciona intestinalis]